MGALPQLFAATSPDAKGGEHYGPKFNFRGHPKLSPTSPFAINQKERKNLWEKSLEILSKFYKFFVFTNFRKYFKICNSLSESFINSVKAS